MTNDEQIQNQPYLKTQDSILNTRYLIHLFNLLNLLGKSSKMKRFPNRLVVSLSNHERIKQIM